MVVCARKLVLVNVCFNVCSNASSPFIPSVRLLSHSLILSSLLSLIVTRAFGVSVPPGSSRMPEDRETGGARAQFVCDPYYTPCAVLPYVPLLQTFSIFEFLQLPRLSMNAHTVTPRHHPRSPSLSLALSISIFLAPCVGMHVSVFVHLCVVGWR